MFPVTPFLPHVFGDQVRRDSQGPALEEVRGPEAPCPHMVATTQNIQEASSTFLKAENLEPQEGWTQAASIACPSA